jgi:broad specificity phosphatase PhoE
MELILLRHGESTGVEKGVLQGRMDVSLTDKGRGQIEKLAGYWCNRGRQFERIISSPLQRAHESARILGGAFHTDVEIDPLWTERDFGHGEGIPLTQIKTWYQGRPEPDAFEARYESGESEWQIHRRAAQAVEKLMQDPAEHTLVVSHGNMIQAALHVLFGLMPYGRSLPVEFALDTASYCALHYEAENGRWRLLSFNDRGHFGRLD